MAAINYLSKADPSSPRLAREHELIVGSEGTFQRGSAHRGRYWGLACPDMEAHHGQNHQNGLSAPP
jgi:hypothetical protein